jgi:hypothetical protein
MRVLTKGGIDQEEEINLGQVDISVSKERQPISRHSPFAINISSNSSILLIKVDPVSRSLEQERRRTKIKTLLRAGCGSLLDAIVTLAQSSSETGIHLTSSLSVALSSTPGASIVNPPRFRLHVALIIKSPLFRLPETISKRILFLHLFPIPDQSSVTVDTFYSSLKRAPRTKNGIALESDRIMRRKRGEEAVKDETEEEQSNRLRRESKGKGREVVVDEMEMQDAEMELGEEDGPEDDLLRPEGLKATLKPFQSRTLRWLLSREGKVALLEPKLEMERSNLRAKANGKYPRAASESDGEMTDIDDGNDKREGTITEEDEDTAIAQAEEEERDTFYLVDISPEKLVALRRSPLWELQSLPLLSPSNATNEMKVDFWINSVTTQLCLEDPDLYYAETEEEVALNEEEEDDEEERLDGHQIDLSFASSAGLFEEMGLGKTLEVISLILMRELTCPYFISIKPD